MTNGKPSMYLTPPTWDALQHVCVNMRAWDRIEVEGFYGQCDPVAVARQFYMMWPHAFLSHVAWSAVSREPVAILMLVRAPVPTQLIATMIATDRFPKIGGALTRHVLKIIKPMLLDTSIRRLQAHAHEGHAVSRHWLERLGAVEEALMPDYGVNGETYVQYAWRKSDVHGWKSEDVKSGGGANPLARQREGAGSSRRGGGSESARARSCLNDADDAGNGNRSGVGGSQDAPGGLIHV